MNDRTTGKANVAARVRLRPWRPMRSRWSMPLRAAAFVGRIVARHSGAAARSTPLEKVQRRLPSLRWTSAFHQHWQLGFAPQLKLQFAGDSLTLARAQAAGPAAPAATMQAVTFVRPGTTLERLLLRTERINSLRATPRIVASHDSLVPAPVAAAPALAAPAAERLRVERIYRERASAAAQASAQAAATVASQAHRQEQVRITDEPAAVTAARAPQLDIQRLADQVVNAIDKRMLAHRERLGRL